MWKCYIYVSKLWALFESLFLRSLFSPLLVIFSIKSLFYRVLYNLCLFSFWLYNRFRFYLVFFIFHVHMFCYWFSTIYFFSIYFEVWLILLMINLFMSLYTNCLHVKFRLKKDIIMDHVRLYVIGLEFYHFLNIIKLSNM